MQISILCAILGLLGAVDAAPSGSIRVPGFTAYLDPVSGHANFSSTAGITHWSDPSTKILWFGEFKTAGEITCAMDVKLPAGATSKLRLTVAGQSHEANVQGKGAEAISVDFGTFKLEQPGYQRFALESLNAAEKPAGDIETLIIGGAAAKDAHFNLKPRRNAASVHLSYPIPKDEKIEAFYAEATAVLDPVATYYEVCGWHRGYFGMQVNGPEERRIIFSVWDSGHEAVSRNKVGEEDRVKLIAKGDGVVAGDFGNEGTGGHSHLVYPWKTGERQRFFLTAKPVDASHTIYSGYYFHPEKKQWMLISSWKAPKDGQWLHGLYSFSENFGGHNGHLQRKALFGNQWLRTAEGKWIEQTTASFSHDPTGKADRFDRFMGVEDGQFFLSNGGFVTGFTAFGEKFTRPATGKPPTDLVLPALPQ